MSATLADRDFAVADPLTNRLIFAESFLDIWHDEKYGWLHLDWKGRQNQTSVRIGAEQVLDLMHTLRIYKVINDNTNTIGSWLDAAPWVVFNLLPRAKKAGLQRAAHVYGRDKLTRLSAEALKLLCDPASENIRVFNNLPDAKIWLSKS